MGSAKCLAVVHISAVVDIRLARIHPPSVYSKSEQVLFYLLPEQFSGCLPHRHRRMTADIRASPPRCRLSRGGNPSVFVKFLEMLRVGIEFRPYGNHETVHPWHGSNPASLSGPDICCGRTHGCPTGRPPNTSSPARCCPPEYLSPSFLPMSRGYPPVKHSVRGLPVAHCPFRHYCAFPVMVR